MKINTDEIRKENSPWIGKDVWITEVNFNMEKPRIIKPKLVRVRDIDEAPKNKRIYYSAVYFSPLGKKGEPLSTVIALFDNTGYRAYTGNPLSVFETEKEANEWFIEKIGNVIQDRIERRENLLDGYDGTTQQYIDLHDDVLGHKSITPKGEKIGNH